MSKDVEDPKQGSHADHMPKHGERNNNNKLMSHQLYTSICQPKAIIKKLGKSVSKGNSLMLNFERKTIT